MVRRQRTYVTKRLVKIFSSNSLTAFCDGRDALLSMMRSRFGYNFYSGYNIVNYPEFHYAIIFSCWLNRVHGVIRRSNSSQVACVKVSDEDSSRDNSNYNDAVRCAVSAFLFEWIAIWIFAR